jgi:hypothetical protein
LKAQNLERGKINDSIRQAIPSTSCKFVSGGLCATLLFCNTAFACPDLCNGDIAILRTNASRYLYPLDSLTRGRVLAGHRPFLVRMTGIRSFLRSLVRSIRPRVRGYTSGTGKYLDSLQDAISREEGLRQISFSFPARKTTSSTFFAQFVRRYSKMFSLQSLAYGLLLAAPLASAQIGGVCPGAVISSPNPIAHQTRYDRFASTGTVNGTYAIMPISFDLARSMIPSQYPILTQQYKQWIPSLADDEYPVCLIKAVRSQQR